jgi:hypothetical protein
MAELGGYGFIEAPAKCRRSWYNDNLYRLNQRKLTSLFKKGELGGTDYSEKQAEQIKASRRSRIRY